MLGLGAELALRGDFKINVVVGARIRPLINPTLQIWGCGIRKTITQQYYPQHNTVASQDSIWSKKADKTWVWHRDPSSRIGQRGVPYPQPGTLNSSCVLAESGEKLKLRIAISQIFFTELYVTQSGMYDRYIFHLGNTTYEIYWLGCLSLMLCRSIQHP